ncbi:hypothetical protein [Maritalea sp.]|uniref:hypothetical protein n=1 Tax=Maritalea sp. TaxID=2003361 RepID=UPI003EF24747
MKTLSLAIVTLATFLTSCSLIPRAPETLDSRQSDIVASDMVQTLALLRGYSPVETTLQLKPSKSGFATSLEQALRKSGYGLQYLSDKEKGAAEVSYEIEAFESAAGKSVGYRVMVGPVELSREYEVTGGRIFPMTGMSVKGVQPSSRALDQTIFDNQHVIVPTIEKKPGSETPKTDGELLDEGWEEVPSDSASTLQNESFDELDERLSGALPIVKKNMFDLGESNFSSIHDDYGVASEVVLIFPDDSMRMGKTNKSVLSNLASDFNIDTDLFSVVGCSMGKTAIPNGNELLAVGRANRVKEELIMANVPTQRILDEGCWSASSGKGLPTRGVVVTHRRIDI